MSKKKISLTIVTTSIVVSLVSIIGRPVDSNVNPLTLANIEALTGSGDVVVVGCRAMKNSTCYVFDGNGQLVDKQKNQYK